MDQIRLDCLVCDQIGWFVIIGQIRSDCLVRDQIGWFVTMDQIRLIRFLGLWNGSVAELAVDEAFLVPCGFRCLSNLPSL